MLTPVENPMAYGLVETEDDLRDTNPASNVELLDALAPQIGSARGRGGERPILLLNGQRISGFRELRDIPTEAIQRGEILPEEELPLRYSGFSTCFRRESGSASTSACSSACATAPSTWRNSAMRHSGERHPWPRGAN